MKVAVCISGICKGNVRKNLERMKYHFPYDYFFGTWQGREKDMESLLPNTPYFTFPEPVVHYHPMIDVVEECPSPKFKLYKEKCRREIDTNNWMLHSIKQILGHSYLVNNLPLEYDMIIRTRYDAVWSTNIDFNIWLEKSYLENRTIGFATRNINHNYNNILENTNKDSKDWFCYIGDNIIMHRRDKLNFDTVISLYKEKKLWGCEWGWYQVLSYPLDNHICICGGVQLEKYLK